MRHYIICIFLLTAIGTQAQQINPVPDYVFRNQMSVGRNAVTDTAAYISIGPRYGANKGMMPPIVSDTAAITGVKRNGLLIFSVQRNNFQYWDSINSRWTSVTANVDTTVISTRAWRQKGIDSLGSVKQNTLTNPVTGTGVSGQVSFFNGTSTVTGDNGLFWDNTNKRLGVGTTTPASYGGAKFAVYSSSGTTLIGVASADTAGGAGLYLEGSSSVNNFAQLRQYSASTAGTIAGVNIAGAFAMFTSPTSTGPMLIVQQGAQPIVFGTNGTQRMRIHANGRVGVGTTTDAGYQFDVEGSIRNTTGAAFATSSGNVGIGTTSAGSKLDVVGAINTSTNYRFNNANFSQLGIVDPGGGFAGGYNLTLSGSTPQHAATGAAAGYYYSQNLVRFFVNESQAGGSNATERMRITSGGNVLIGTTTDGGQMLQVSGTTLLSNTVTFANSNTGGVSWGNPSINGGSQIFFRSLTTNWVGLVNSSSHGIFITNTNANVLIGNLYSDSVGGVRTIVHNNGTAPTGNVTDSYQLYSNDIVAGNAAPHFRTENGAVVKVYQETTGVGAATFVQGSVNAVYEDSTFDGYTLKQIVKALRNQGLLA